jgi:integrase
MEYAHANKAHTTATRDGYSVKCHLIPFFGGRLLTSITPKLIEDYKRERRKVVKTATINTELVTLKAMLNKAVEWGYIRKSPADRVKKLRRAVPVTRFLSNEEIKKLFAACHGSGSIFLYPFVATALYTGMRKSELFHLEWSDVDFEGQVIRVQPKVDWHTKNYKMRAIPIHPDLLKILRGYWQRQHGILVFCNDGKALQDIRRSYNNAIQKANIPHVTFHALRHTFASHMVMKGVDLATVQQHLGHADIQTTMRYAHLAPGHVQQSVRILDWDTTDVE